MIIILLAGLCLAVQGQVVTNTKALLKFAAEKKAAFKKQKKAALEFAAKNNIPVFIETDQSFAELMYFDRNGRPQYYLTSNVNAAKTISTNKVHPGAGYGLSLDGDGMTVHEWDADAVRKTHQEFGNRVTQVDGETTTHGHSTHVAGTLIASGVVANALGMAPAASLDAYDWDYDDSEMATAAANGALVSNHSYGFARGWTSGVWYGDPAISSDEDYLFGFYDSNSNAWDRIAYDAPEYLICKAAGNDRNDTGDGTYPDDGPYDCISQRGVSKNVLTVAAVNDIPGGYTQSSDVVMSDFSSWGPADDGRIKPDISANGVTLYSCYNTADNSYATMSGTSMATPSVAGSLILLQEHYQNLFGNGKFMLAATLKALVIHTADEAGTDPGPDYMFGWGLMNTYHAAQKITEDQTTDVISEKVLENGGTYTRDVLALGTEPLKVTICWTDYPGTPVSAQLDPDDAMLVNDLDLRVTGAKTTYYPWKLDRDNPVDAATNNGENNVDNVEVVYIANPTASTYTITVDHDGNLTNGSQAFSIIISGISNQVAPASDFTCDDQFPVTGQTVKFTDDSDDIPTSWSWSFSPSTVTYQNGTSSTSQNPEVQFNANGAYTVTLTATNANGSDGETKTAYIHVGTPGKWTGNAKTTEWTEETNWENHWIPNDTTNVTITDGAASWPVYPGDFTVGLQCNSLTLSGASQFTVEGDLSIQYGKTFSVNSTSTALIKVENDWLGTGNFVPGQSTVEFYGTDTSAIHPPLVPVYLISDSINAWPGDWNGDVAGGNGQFSWYGSSAAGGDSPEARFYWKDETATKRMYHDAVNTTGLTGLILEFQYMMDDYSGRGYTIKAQYSTDAVNWHDVWSVSPTCDIPASRATVNLTASEGVGAATYYISFTITGDLGNLNFWALDNILLYHKIAGTGQFYNLTADKTLAPVSTGGNFNILNDFDIKPESWFTNETGNTINIGGDFLLEADDNGMCSFIDKGTTNVTGSTNVEYYCVSDYWHFISSCFDPGSDHFDDLFSGGPDPTDFYRWDESHTEQGSTGWWINILHSSEWTDNTFTPARGYAISDYTKGTTYTLSGDLYNTDKSIAMTKTTGSSAEGWNLIGNPFSCSLAANTDADADHNFLSDNASLLDVNYQALYFWDDNIGDYTTVNNSLAAIYISRGQGFMVKTAADGNTVSFGIASRKHGAATFYKSNDESSRFLLTVTNPQNKINPTEIVFRENMTYGLDPSYDAGKFKGNSQLSLYSLPVEGNGAEMAIQALPLLTKPVTVPIGLYAGMPGNYSFTVSLTNFDETIPVTLVDKVESKQVDLMENPEYHFTIDEAGTYNDRFVIRFKSAVGLEENDQGTGNDLMINVAGHQITILSSSAANNYSATVFNTTGQLILQRKYVTNQMLTFNIQQTGIYIVRIVSGRAVVTQKVMIR